MKDKIDAMELHPTSAKLAKILCQKTLNPDPLFFHVQIAYYMAKVASMMRCSIATHDRGLIPVNCYAINLAPSGYGKGLSTNILEDEVLGEFRSKFVNETFKGLAEVNIAKLGNKQAVRNATDPDDEIEKLTKEFNDLGDLLFSFDSATSAAIKQMRNKLLLADSGSVNMEIDEIGSNLVSNIDALNTFLELYDVGKVKEKLTKNTTENKRATQIQGRTPTNMMLFGTPSKLLNGSKTEEEFKAMLEAGYGRRCFFGFSRIKNKNNKLTPEERYDLMTNVDSADFIEDLSDELCQLADAVNFKRELSISKETTLLLLEYQTYCEDIADELPEHQSIQKAEITHRYFKALKLAGAYAFSDGSHEVTSDHVCNAIKLAELSGEGFTRMMNQDKNYVKLARYLSETSNEVTQVDLVEDLPFYKGSSAVKNELMQMAITYGYKNGIVIKRNYIDGIEFISGESLKETDLNKMLVSYGTHFGEGYENDFAKFEELHNLTQLSGYHWVNHHLKAGNRNEASCISGFNLVAIDVDNGVSLDTAKFLLKDYKYLIYTTKSHKVVNEKNKTGCDRFRIIFPLSHTLEMDATEYKEFMNNVYEWLPFESDEQTNQRSRKWESFNGSYEYNDGQVLEAFNFIPKTSKCDKIKASIQDLKSLSNLERWFIHNTASGNRSNQLIKYALMLVDSGMDFASVQTHVLGLNSKLADKLTDDEVTNTILRSATKAIQSRDA